MYALIRSIMLCFVLASVPVALAHASTVEEEASVLFREGKFEEAMQKWNLSLKEGQRTAGVYFNIGLAESRLQHIPQAILAFEKARRIKPYSKEIRLAIDEERAKIPGAVVPGKPFFLQEYYHQFLGCLRPGTWAFCGLMLLAGFVLYQFRKRNAEGQDKEKRRTIKYVLLVCGWGMLLCGLLAYQSLYRSDEAIIMQSCELKQAPDSGSPTLNLVPAGEKVVITDSLSGWYQVRLLNFEEGWIEGKCPERIIP